MKEKLKIETIKSTNIINGEPALIYSLRNSQGISKTEVTPVKGYSSNNISFNIKKAKKHPEFANEEDVFNIENDEEMYQQVEELMIKSGADEKNRARIIRAETYDKSKNGKEWVNKSLHRGKTHYIRDLKRMAQDILFYGEENQKRIEEMQKIFCESTNFKPIYDEKSAIDSLGLKEVHGLEDASVSSLITDTYINDLASVSLKSVYRTLQDFEDGEKPILVQLWNRETSGGKNEFYRKMDDGIYCNLSSFKISDDGKGTFEKCTYEEIMDKAKSLGLEDPEIKSDERVAQLLKNGISLTLTQEEINSFKEEYSKRKENGTLKDDIKFANFVSELGEIYEMEQQELGWDR